MFCDAIDKDQINVFSEGSDLHFYMGQICFMLFAFVKQGKFDLSLTPVPKLCGRNLLIMVKELAFCSEPYDIVLPHAVKL